MTEEFIQPQANRPRPLPAPAHQPAPPPGTRDQLVAALLGGQAAYEGMDGCDAEKWVDMANEIADLAIKNRKP